MINFQPNILFGDAVAKFFATSERRDGFKKTLWGLSSSESKIKRISNLQLKLLHPFWTWKIQIILHIKHNWPLNAFYKINWLYYVVNIIFSKNSCGTYSTVLIKTLISSPSLGMEPLSLLKQDLAKINLRSDSIFHFFGVPLAPLFYT